MNQKRDVSLWSFVGFAFASFAGTILHFLYEWTGENKVAAVFSGINESTWEHIKLLFFPLLFFSLIQRVFFRKYTNYWCIKARSISVGLFMIPFLFFGYNGIIGPSPAWFNIAIFYISAASAFIIETLLFSKYKTDCKNEKASLCYICIIGVLFVLFTFFTPQIAFFIDPVTGTYGIV